MTRLVNCLLILLLLSSCSDGKGKTYSVNASYLISNPTYTGITVRSGGYIPRGHDLSNRSFAYIKFHSLTDATNPILLCNNGTELTWFIIKKPPKHNVVLYEWFKENKTFGTKVDGQNPWLAEATNTLGIKWSSLDMSNDIQEVIGSSLSGSKGMFLGDQIKSPHIKELSNLSAPTKAIDWLDGMLKACM